MSGLRAMRIIFTFLRLHKMETHICCDHIVSQAAMYKIRLASILNAILYTTLHILIGLNWKRDVGFCTFGVITMNVTRTNLRLGGYEDGCTPRPQSTRVQTTCLTSAYLIKAEYSFSGRRCDVYTRFCSCRQCWASTCRGL
jgi:hypothetical protein